jgi:hypothetical protein
MNFFDCIYLNVSELHARKMEDISGFSALAVIAGVQVINVFSLYLIVCLIMQKKFPVPAWFLLLLYFLLIFLNGLRYYKIDFSTLREQWV